VSEPRSPVRHGSRTRRPSRGTPGDPEAQAPPPADLQTTFAALARRSRLPTRPDTRPGEVLRAAGLPLLLAAMVASAPPASAAEGSEPVTPSPSQHAAGAGWSVTPLTTVQSPTTGSDHSSGQRPGASTGHRPGTPGTGTGTPGTGTAARTTCDRADATRTDGRLTGTTRSRPPTTGATRSRRPTPGPPAFRPPTTAATPPPGALAQGVGAAGPATSGASGTRPYVVRAGDTLTAIARQAGTALPEVLALNHLQPNSVIRPGQRLLLPDPPAGTVENTAPARRYPPAVMAAAEANRRALAGARLPSRDQARTMVVATARALGVDPALALAVTYQESGFDQHQVSPANAVGVMQVTPSAAKWASAVVGRPLDLLDTTDNITAGLTLLRVLVDSATEPEAIAGYYQGLSSVREHGMFDDTRRYVATVQTLTARFGARS
jgi:N-acetylmuramoyl-L-alanine amidase